MTRDDKGRYVSGESGNPSGRRAKDIRYYEIIVSAVSLEKWRKIVLRAANDAERGDSVARKWLGDYIVGAPEQVLKLLGPDNGPIPLTLVDYRAGITETAD